jgi:hypothetical protein
MEIAAKDMQIASLESKAREANDASQAAAARVARVRACAMRNTQRCLPIYVDNLLGLSCVGSVS